MNARLDARWAAPLALAVSLLGCDGGPAMRACTPGTTQACLGPGRCDGVQVCVVEGTGFSACACGRDAGGPGLDASTTDAGSTDAGSSSPDGGCGACGAGLLCVDGRCVECRNDDDCTFASAPNCAGGSCGDCMVRTDCARFTDTPACGPDGACVECSPASQATDCEMMTCDPSTLECTGVVPGTRAPCEACASDDDCQMGSWCVETTFVSPMMVTLPAGRFCLPRQDFGGCPASLRRVQPATSVGGSAGLVMADFCFPHAQTSCPALGDFGAMCMNDAECGLGMGDGICQGFQCTVPCAGSSDCPTMSVCSMGGYCF